MQANKASNAMLFICSLPKPKANQGLNSTNASAEQLLGRQPLNKTVALYLQLVSAVTAQSNDRTAFVTVRD
jgi:hypothetical protein